jgi:hypothetical protein
MPVVEGGTEFAPADAMLTATTRMRLRRLCLTLGLAAALAAVACGGERDGLSVNGQPLVTIEECHELGGSPLFDPDDGRPVELSCPDGLSFLGEFEEPFFGTDGGLCCGGLTEPEA